MRRAIGTCFLLTAAAVLLQLAGCASPTSPGEVARNWSCKLREMQIRPIFPPREDVHVGDVFWLEQIAASEASGQPEKAANNSGDRNDIS